MPGAPGDRESQPGTDTQLDSGSWSEAAQLTVPGLTILYHPDLSRVGERTLLPGLASGGEHALSRLAPEFAAPGGTERRPLDDPRLSRGPLRLAAGPTEGSVRLSCARTRTRVVVDGTPVDETRELAAADVERGVVLLLGGQVVLLLHRLDPLSDPQLPRFGLVGDGAAMVRLRRAICQVANLAVPVLLRGETGTGKELVAQAIHRAGPRRDGPWVAVNMAALPASLAAAELFGAAKGAYTGAERRRSGYFQRAQGGTLFLDEVGEMPPEVQVQLLRSLESREIQPVGAEKSEPVDVRVISATDSDLEAEIAAGRFRGSLLHRLSGYVIRIPPLRARREDFGSLLVEFLRRELAALGDPDRLEPGRPLWLPAPVVARLAAGDWPGNVRQLRNVVGQLVIANRGAEVVTCLEPLAELERPGAAAPEEPRLAPRATAAEPARKPRRASEIREAELLAALRANRWRLRATADALGIPRSSLYDLIEKNPRIRKASDLSREEIEASRERSAGSVEAMSEALEVSERALRRRMRQLGLS